ncbi:hypothetical protein SAMN05444003_2358 [Cognatiyoonia sediminum]|uniref:Uncharacterized protein n=1 Tax=Cognatiyoonia sediminum TaxID=1508389 RepID=A0A1M5QWT3_9RHOB|nr:hypothetical protein SAMN05444003_2358 [Cognatiyoonia sediminum]
MNNSLIDLRSLENATNFARSNGPLPFVELLQAQFENVVLGRNLFHAPNLIDGNTVPGLDLSSKFEPSYQGRLVLGEAGTSLQTAYGNSGLGIIPAPNAPIPTTGESAEDDFFGNLRPASSGAGALQPSS